MCGEGVRRSKGATARWYAKQARMGRRRGWFGFGTYVVGDVHADPDVLPPSAAITIREEDDTMCHQGTTPGQAIKRGRAQHRAFKRGHLLRGAAWFGALREGPVAWFRWVFVDVEAHEDTCRWRRFVCRYTGLSS